MSATQCSGLSPSSWCPWRSNLVSVHRHCHEWAVSPSVPTADDAIDVDPYRHARAEYADRYADLAAGKRNWQLAALGMFALAAMSATVSIIQVRQVKRIPYVVAIDRSDGYAITIPTPMSSSNTSIDLHTIEQNEVAAFIRHARTIDGDVAGEDALLRDVKAHVRGQADHFLADYYTDYAHRPYLVARDRSTHVTIASLIGVGGFRNGSSSGSNSNGEPNAESVSASLKAKII